MKVSSLLYLEASSSPISFTCRNLLHHPASLWVQSDSFTFSSSFTIPSKVATFVAFLRALKISVPMQKHTKNFWKSIISIVKRSSIKIICWETITNETPPKICINGLESFPIFNLLATITLYSFLFETEYRTRGAVALRCFASKVLRNEEILIKKQQMTPTKKPILLKKVLDGYLDERIQAGSFREIWFWKLINKITILIELFDTFGWSQIYIKEQNQILFNVRVI